MSKKTHKKPLQKMMFMAIVWRRVVAPLRPLYWK